MNKKYLLKIEPLFNIYLTFWDIIDGDKTEKLTDEDKKQEQL